MPPPKEEPVDWEEDEEDEANFFLTEVDLAAGDDGDVGDNGGDGGAALRFIDTRRGRKALIYKGYIFYLSSTVRQSTYWKCSLRKCNCPATMIVKNWDKKKGTWTSFSEGRGAHSHLPSKERLRKREEELTKERIPTLDVNGEDFKNSRHLCLFCLSGLPKGYQDAATWEMILPSGQTLSIALNDATKNLQAFEVLCTQLNVRWRKKKDGLNFDPGRALPLCYTCQSIYQELWQVHRQIRELERVLAEQAKVIRGIIGQTEGQKGKVLLDGEQKKGTQLWMLGLHLFRKKVLDPVFNMRGNDNDMYMGQEPPIVEVAEDPPVKRVKWVDRSVDSGAEKKEKGDMEEVVPAPVTIKQEVDEVNNALNELLEDNEEPGRWMDDGDNGGDDDEDNSVDADDKVKKPEETRNTRRSLRNTKKEVKVKEKDEDYLPDDEEEDKEATSEEEEEDVPSSESDSDSDYSSKKQKSKAKSKSCSASTSFIPIPRRPRGRPRLQFTSSSRHRPSTNQFRSKRYNKLNICHLCDARIVGGKAFREHYSIVHPNERRYTCKYCQRHFTHPSSVLTHQRNRHTGEKPFQCQSCPATFANSTLLISHTKARHEDHSNDEFPCSECELTFNNKTILNNHLVAAHGQQPKTVVYYRSGKPIKTLQCHLCDAQIVGQGPFLQHYRENHPEEKRYTCKFCKRHFPYIREVLTHQRRHTGEKPFQCVQCSKHFIDDRSLRNHVLYHHGDQTKEFRCSLCPKVYKVKAKLTCHMYTHKELIVICKTCGKTFRTAHTFYKHNKREHGGSAKCTKPVSSEQGMNPDTLKKMGVEEVQCRRKCHVCWAPIPGKWFLRKHFAETHPNHPGDVNTCRCGKHFDNYKKVYNHALRHHTTENDKHFQCSLCPSRFLCLRELKNHERTHIPVEERRKEFICPVCGKGLSNPYAYQRHVKKHEEGPKTRYVCEECGKDYAEKKGLQAHKKLEHLKIKPHKCPFEGCGKSFPLRSILLKHQNIHTGENKYDCELCGKNFHYSGSLKRHLREVHNSLGDKGQTPRKKKGKRVKEGEADYGTAKRENDGLEEREMGHGSMGIGGMMMPGYSQQGMYLGSRPHYPGMMGGYPGVIQSVQQQGMDLKVERQSEQTPGGSSGY